MRLLPLASLLFISLLGFARAETLAPFFPRSTPEAEGIDSTGVLRLVDALATKIDSVHSIMLLRHGKVVAEGWWAPYSPDDVHILYSATKSFTSTAIGFAIQEGRLSLDDRVVAFFPELAPIHPSANLQAMRVRDLLRMNSGHQNDTIDRLRTHTDGAWKKAFLALEVENRPGTRFVYNSGASYMLSAIIQKVTGLTLEAYLQPRLFDPLGITSHPWGLSTEGVGLGDGGLSLRTEDFAKFGQFYLQKGTWQGRQLLSAPWIAAATSSQTANGSDPDSNWEHGYGYQFWINKTTGYRADGALGQFCFVLPDYDVVLAITSGTTDLTGVMNTVWQQLLPALHYVGLPADPVAQTKLAERLRELALPAQTGEPHSPREASVNGLTYKFPANEDGIDSVHFDFSPDRPPVVVFQNSDGLQSISVGAGHWTRGRTGFQKHISRLFDRPDQGVAASGAWTSPDIFTTKLCFDETPYIITYRFNFEGDHLLLDTEYNVRWGPTQLPQLKGSREN